MSDDGPAAVPLRDPAAVPLDGRRRSRGDAGRSERPSLIGLFRQLPAQLSRLIRDELRAAQAELAEKAKAAGLGAGLLAGAAVLAFFAFGTLIATVILALALVMPAWLAALIVALVLLVIAAVLGFIGQKKLKEGVPPVPKESIDNVKADIRTVRGTNR